MSKRKSIRETVVDQSVRVAKLWTEADDAYDIEADITKPGMPINLQVAKIASEVRNVRVEVKWAARVSWGAWGAIAFGAASFIGLALWTIDESKAGAVEQTVIIAKDVKAFRIDFEQELDRQKSVRNIEAKAELAQLTVDAKLDKARAELTAASRLRFDARHEQLKGSVGRVESDMSRIEIKIDQLYHVLATGKLSTEKYPDKPPPPPPASELPPLPPPLDMSSFIPDSVAVPTEATGPPG